MVQGSRIQNATVLFYSAAGFHMVLGRPELINAFDAGFDPSHWHYG